LNRGAGYPIAFAIIRLVSIAPESTVTDLRRRPRGFTLIEILVVVVILALLAAFIVPRVMGRVDDARLTKARGDIQSLETALAMYRLDTARLPTTEQGLTALVTQPVDPSIRNWKPGGYLARVSRDPWGNEYRYRVPAQRGGEFDLWSMGPDGQEGGSETDRDNIGNWNLGD
jgi:general secretion pathway protein G